MSEASFTRLMRPLRDLFAARAALPPELPAHYDAADFGRFMCAETALFEPGYVRARVRVHGAAAVRAVVRTRGAILAPLHYGSFFLICGAVRRQMKLHGTAIVTSRNLAYMPVAEADFWRGVHRRSEALYEQRLFHAGVTPVREMLRFVDKPGHLLLAMLDVREGGHYPPEFPFRFARRTIHLAVGPARLAGLAKVPLVPTVISYRHAEKMHHLHFGEPVWPDANVQATTQELLARIDAMTDHQQPQFFHDLLGAFAQPHVPG